MTVEKGRKVSFTYTLTVDGNVIDSSEGRGPLQYVHGQGQIIEGLSRELEGMQAGEEKSVDIPALDAYGEVDPKAFQEVPRTQLPQGMEPQVGMTLEVKAPNGSTFPAQVSQVNKESVTLDFNHPLAGKTLHFDVKIVSIE